MDPLSHSASKTVRGGSWTVGKRGDSYLRYQTQEKTSAKREKTEKKKAESSELLSYVELLKNVGEDILATNEKTNRELCKKQEQQSGRQTTVSSKPVSGFKTWAEVTGGAHQLGTLWTLHPQSG